MEDPKNFAPTIIPQGPQLRERLFSDRTYRIGSENAFRVGPQIRELELQGYRVIKCNLGEPDFPLPKYIADEVKRQIDCDLTHYCDPQGILPLREAIARIVSRTRKIAIRRPRCGVPGGKPPIGLTQQTYCNPGDEVIYPSPGFPIYESFTGYVGAKPVPLHLREEFDFSFGGRELAPLITDRTRLIILNFPSNTGGIASREQLEEIANVIYANAPEQVRIYSDEIYEDILFDGNHHQSIASCRGYPAHHHCGRRIEVVCLDRGPCRMGGVSDNGRSDGLQEPEHKLFFLRPRLQSDGRGGRARIAVKRGIDFANVRRIQ